MDIVYFFIQVYYNIKWKIINCVKAVGGFFERLLDANSSLSSMRLWRLIIVFLLAVQWVYELITLGTFNPSTTLVSMVGLFFGFSVFQEYSERKYSQSSEGDIVTTVIDKISGLFKKDKPEDNQELGSDETPIVDEE